MDGEGEYRTVLEICVGSRASAVAAHAGGADRIELCASLDDGGLTPETSLVEEVTGAVDIPVHVMVRPRAGDFVYSKSEFDLMKESVAAFRRLGCAGIVTGILTPEGVPDAHRTAELVRLAGGMNVTFHRAMDHTPDILAAASMVSRAGVRRILTSGGAEDALTGSAAIARLVSAAGGMSVIAGGGVTVGTAGEIVRATGVRELHSRSGVCGKDGAVDPRLVRRMKQAMNVPVP